MNEYHFRLSNLGKEEQTLDKYKNKPSVLEKQPPLRINQSTVENKSNSPKSHIVYIWPLLDSNVPPLRPSYL
jgi:hypothetical protein